MRTLFTEECKRSLWDNYSPKFFFGFCGLICRLKMNIVNCFGLMVNRGRATSQLDDDIF